MKVNEFLIDGGKSAMMTMRRRPLADRSKLELRQPKTPSRGIGEIGSFFVGFEYRPDLTAVKKN